MIGKIRNLQVYLIKHLWGKLPIRVKVLVFQPNGELYYKMMWWTSKEWFARVSFEIHGLLVIPIIHIKTVHPVPITDDLIRVSTPLKVGNYER